MARRPSPYDRHIALACHLQTFQDNWLEVQCCIGVKRLPIRMIGNDTGRTLADIVVRLRCEKCSGAPVMIALIEHPQTPPETWGGTQAWRLILVESTPTVLLKAAGVRP